ncbi:MULTISPECIES: anti-sigma-F factor Fin family protein [Pontibacillus]|uniref:Anti-sigma-F factor Fin family protein n=1 Tax=Pontibacillus chungwhensis TaxID=265426 RepID=A0ABY8UYX7_9BACI|nr:MULTISPECIES: anti-sigma-F factor Fin family protein [Pontibacillus]MCD5326101.1 anti-sigma-F factor Fin family protein [Pontibacillus sp. HN14]WIF98202.1 anti-sigma-F factor Fin family protein [Pontibacillus chungwhensis]
MAVKYQCRHCKKEIGELSQDVLDSVELGLTSLNEEELLDMVSYHENGDVMVRTICEDCQESLEENPHYHELDFFIH